MATTVVGNNLKAPTPLTLKQLNAQPQDAQSLGDIFPVNVDTDAPVVNLPSSVNNAAHAALLAPDGSSPDDMINAYHQALAEDTLSGQSATASNLYAGARAAQQQASQGPLMDVLNDPSMTDDQKRAALDNVYDKNSTLYTPQNMVSSKALNTPVGSSDNGETNSTRYSIAGQVAAMNKAKDDVQKVYSSNMNLHEPTMARKAVSLLMGLTPAKSYMVAKMAADSSDAPVKAFLSTFVYGKGDYIQDMKNKIGQLPPDEQGEAAQKLADIINSSSSIMGLPDEGLRREMLQSTLGYQGYNTPQAVLGNISTWVDDLVVAGSIKSIAKVAGLGKVADTGNGEAAFRNWKTAFDDNYANAKSGSTGTSVAVPGKGMDTTKGVDIREPPSGSGGPLTVYDPKRDATQDGVRSQVQPSSIYQNLKDTNPDMARNTFGSAIVDKTGEAAQATGGTSRSDMIFSAMAPEIQHADGSIASKVFSPDAMQQLRDAVPFEVQDMIAHDGKSQYIQTEKAAARAWKVNQFESAIGFTPRGEMFTLRPDLNNFTTTPNGMSVTGVYGPMNNGFSDAWDAVDLGKFALRNTGIPQSDIGLLRRVDGNYVPTTLEELPKLKEKASTWTHATPDTGPVEAEAVGSKGYRFDMTDQPTTMDVHSIKLEPGQWIREVVAKDKNGEQIGRLIYTNYDRPPSVRVYPGHQRQGVATAMYKFARNQGGTLGDAKTGEFANGNKAGRSEEGQAFRSNANMDSVSVYHKNIPFVDDYLIKVDHNYMVSAGDVTKSEELTGQSGWSPLKVKLNFFDRVVFTNGRQGTLSDILFDQASMLDPIVVQSAVAAGDKASAIEKALLKGAGNFADGFKSLPHNQQLMVDNEIRQANLERREHNTQTMTASGMSMDAMDAVQAWRKYWDTDWVLENGVLSKKLDTYGYKEYVHTGTNTSLPVKPIGESSVPHGVNVLDPETDKLVTVSPEDVKLLYKDGGGIARLKEQFQLANGQRAEYVLHRSNPSGGYLKAFTPDSQVLNYIPGYYPIRYKDPFHIVETVKDENGKELFQRSVATAKDTASAKLLKARMEAQHPESDWHYRKANELDPERGLTDHLSEAQASGRTTFRYRGKLLQDSTSAITDLSHTHVQNPVETMVNSARRLSKQIAMGDITDAMDQRMMWQWDYFPKDEFGSPYIPKDIREIKYRGVGDQDQGAVADARRSAQFSNFLKYSAVNLVDDAIKGTLQNVADLFGQTGLSTLERGSRGLSTASLTRGMKSLSYYAYLGTAPLRQVLIQGNQAVLLGILNPKWVTSADAFTQPMYIALRTMGVPMDHPAVLKLGALAWGDSFTADRVFQQFHRSGLAAAVDQQNFISGAVNDMARNMIAQTSDNALATITKPIHTVAKVLRQVGFDAGEFYQQSMSWLAHRDLAVKAGMDPFRDDVADKITGASRNWTGNMNSNGDMMTNKNALFLLFQYTQNSQKMLLNLTFNRGIPRSLRWKLGLYSLALFGVGGIGGSDLYFKYINSHITNDDAKDGVRQGMEGLLFNKSLSLAGGGKSVIDWTGGLSPFNAYGALDLVHSIFTMNVPDMIANSPTASLMFGQNPRITNAVKSFARYTHLIDDYQDPTTLLEVANNFAKISSGYTALARATYIVNLGKKINTSGTVTQDNISKENAIAIAMGFQTIQDAQRRFVNDSMYRKKQDIINDTTEWYKQLKLHYLNDKLTGDPLLNTQRMLNEAHRMGFLDTPLGRQTFTKLVDKDLQDGDARMYNNIMAACPLYNKGDCKALINAAPFDDENARKSLLDLVDMVNNYHQPDYDSKKDK